MIRLLALFVLLLSLGCNGSNQVATHEPSSETGVQLFNEAVLGCAPTHEISVLLNSESVDWSPRQVVLDYEDGTCYGAMVHYDRTQSFEALRAAINARFGIHEQPTFAADPTMGIWRMEDAGFTIQLSDNNEEDSYTAIYVRFVDPATMASKLEELSETEPELFDDFPLDEFTDSLSEADTTNSTAPDGG